MIARQKQMGALLLSKRPLIDPKIEIGLLTSPVDVWPAQQEQTLSHSKSGPAAIVSDQANRQPPHVHRAGTQAWRNKVNFQRE